MRQREQIREQPERPRDPRRELAEEAEPGVDVGPLPHRRDQEPTLQRRLARDRGSRAPAGSGGPRFCAK